MTTIEQADTTREDLAECLAHMVSHAKRQQYIVEKFTDDQPTPWTMAHRHIDAVLDHWLAAGPNCRTCGRSKASCDAEPRRCCEICLANGHGD